MIAPILQTTVYVRSFDQTHVLLMYRNKRADDDHFGFVFRADAYRGTPHESCGEGTLEWVPIEDLVSRPMWNSDHRWLPMVFDEDPKPFHGVMPYDGYEMVSWSFQR